MNSTTDLDTKIHKMLDQLDRAAPTPPKFEDLQPRRATSQPRFVAVAAAAITIAGVGGLIAVNNRSNEPIQPAAQPPAAPIAVGFSFETPTVKLDASSIEVITDDRSWAPTGDVVVNSDPGMPNEYTTLELTWHENAVEQRVSLYFQSDGIDWWINEIGTFDGHTQGEWAEPAITGQYARTPLGTPFVGNLVVPNLRIENVTLEAFRRPAICDNPTQPIALLADYPVIDSNVGGYGATFQMIDTATCTPLAVAPYEFDYTVDDATIVAIDPDEPLAGYPEIKTRVGLNLLQPGATTVRATASDDTGAIISSATMNITVHPAPLDNTPLDTTAPPVAIQTDTVDDTEQSDLAAEIERRIAILTEQLATEQLATLDYTITSTQTATDAPTTIVLDSNTDNRTIVIKMSDGTPLQPENHDRVPITIVNTNDLQVRGQLASNSGWTFEVLAERSTSDGPLPTPDELQEILYSLDP